MIGKISVLVAGEQALMREGIRSLLKAYEDIEVVQEAIDGRQTVEAACNLQPHVVVMDASMKAMNGFEATRHLSRDVPKTNVVILTEHAARDDVIGAILAGAQGCLPKSAPGADLASAIRVVYGGEMYLHPSLTRILVQAYLSLRKLQAPGDPYEQLTERERHVLRLIAEGRTSRQIAQELGIAVKTAAHHRDKVMSKLSIHRQAELIKYAIMRHVVDLKPRNRESGALPSGRVGSKQ